MAVMSTMRVGILTVSDAGSRGEREDTSGAAVREIVVGIGGDVARYEVVPDERQRVGEVLKDWCDRVGLDLVLTTGGTGLSARDVTPEATLDVAERLVPGIAEAMRAEGLRHTPRAMLSRGVAVVRGHTLIVNLPGSEKGARESLEAVRGVLTHAVDLLRGHTEHPASGGAGPRS
jgi:molybdenum cofactor synthesis domain-containing protein